MSTEHAGYTRRLLFVNRAVAGAILFGCASVVTGLVEVRIFNNEVEYAMKTKEDANRFKPHRCNDRLADVLEVVESEDGNMWRDLRPTFRKWWACMRSAEGMEPATPYTMLTPKDKQYIDPSLRHPDVRQHEAGQHVSA